ncbi:hypothetical protein BKA67DRAFT_537361 [Truncatella angustata]|uniref:Uncharacterized protein n=1 Tax=Truncatella angustata TaxID=152316 RepID=A0A9P8UFX9_9PEZI|nr:uncharacterized protein BKA67DRAFT_537361 [Truncatella angustata]KAH6651489.1 hypothetical protein BKA67DRAFT_537361 [Truncatella angustata]
MRIGKTHPRPTLTASSFAQWTSTSQIEKGYVTDSEPDQSADCLLSMKAPDRVLYDNPMPLQEFSALRDFSGENVAYLTRVANWRASWPTDPKEDEVWDQFTQALGIYTDLISPRDAEFSINLSSQEL